MKILLVSQYFWPETFIINELVKCLVNQGHTIEVLTAKPNYPDGKIFQGYSAAGCTTDYFDNKIPVHRVPLIPRGKGNGKRLILNYLSFIWNGIFYFHKLIKKKNFDIIFVYAPSPIMSVIPAIYLKKRLKLPLAVWVQDLWPESLSATGFVRNPFILNFVGSIVRRIYRISDKLLIQSHAFKIPVSKYAAEEKIVYYPNSYFDIVSNNLDDTFIPKNLLMLFENNRCFVFAGNLGTAQSLHTLMQAAEQLKHLVDCKIILIGSGSMSEWVKQQIVISKLDNVIMAGRFPPSAMPSIFARASGLLVTLRKDEIFAYTIPSKIQAYFAAGRPIIAAIDGEGGRVIIEAGAGFVSAAEDAVSLAKNIEKLYYTTELEQVKMGQAGRTYFLEHFEMVTQSHRLIKILEEMVSSRRKNL